MVKVEKQLSTPGRKTPLTLLCFDSDIPSKRFTKLVIDGQEYKPIMVYDMKNAYAVEAEGDFEGKVVEFK